MSVPRSRSATETVSDALCLSRGSRALTVVAHRGQSTATVGGSDFDMPRMYRRRRDSYRSSTVDREPEWRCQIRASVIDRLVAVVDRVRHWIQVHQLVGYTRTVPIASIEAAARSEKRSSRSSPLPFEPSSILNTDENDGLRVKPVDRRCRSTLACKDTMIYRFGRPDRTGSELTSAPSAG